MMSCLEKCCSCCVDCCCPLDDEPTKYPHIEYKSPDEARIAVTVPEIQKVPLDKLFEFQQPGVEYPVHPQLSPPVISEQPRAAYRTSSEPRESSPADSISPAQSTSSFPMLQFSLYFDIQRRTLVVHLQQAINLPPKDRSGTRDPYVVMFLLPNREVILESPVVHKTLDPIFEKMFEFTGLLPQEIRRQTLMFWVYDHDKSKNNVIGVVRLSLEEADLFGVTVKMRIEERVEHLRTDSKGDLLISLAYKPENSILYGTVLKATNLQKQDITGTADPYVKVYVRYQGRKIEKLKWKSTVKRRTLLPIFNESFQFELTSMNISEVSLQIVMMDWDRFSKNDVVGVVYVGEGVEEEMGRVHWEEVICTPNQAVSRWHSIRPMRPDEERARSATF